MKKVKWEMAMKEQRELRTQGASLLYKRVKLLIECYDSQEFQAWCKEQDIVDLDYLDAELADVACDFLTLKAVMDSNSDESTWQRCNIRDLIAEVIAEQKAKRDNQEQRVSWKERAMMAEKECERLRNEVNVLSARLSELQEALAIVSSGKRPILEMSGK